MGAARKGKAAAIAIAALLALTGCSAGEPSAEEVLATLPPEAMTGPPAPTFATDEEALAAGVTALQAALDMEIEVTSGRAIPERFVEVAEGGFLDDLREGVAKYQNDGIRFDGRYGVSGILLQHHWIEDQSHMIQFIACVDISNVRRSKVDGTLLPATNPILRNQVVSTARVTSYGALVSEMERWNSGESC